MSELDKAWNSATASPLHTLEFLHSGLTGGALRLVQGYYDIEATLEDASTVTFTAAGFAISLPARSTDGRQDLQIQLDNVSKEVYDEVKAVKVATRTTEEKIICKYRPFLEADLSAPAGSTYILTVTQSTINRRSATLTAKYTPVPDIQWPYRRYFTNNFPGLKYVR